MKTSTTASPRVEHIDWGEMSVADPGTGKDFKLWPGGEPVAGLFHSTC